MIKVGVNGYGVIGKRVADAVMLQDDMELVGIAKRDADYKAIVAAKHGISIFNSGDEKGFRGSDIEVAGTLDDMLSQVDVVVDCTPEGVGASNKQLYDKRGIKAIWEGGEEHELTGMSFNAYANYDKAVGAERVRVVSCNTTGLIRTLYPLQQAFGIESVNAVLVRRAADPPETKKGPINALEPDAGIPSHHGPDVKTVMSGLNIETVAIKAPTTIMHLHYVDAVLRRQASADEILAAWKKYRRIKLFSFNDDVKSTAQIQDFARDMGRNRGDLYEIAVWQEIRVDGRHLRYFQAVHQESDVVPENIDAIRALSGTEPNGQKSIDKTDKSMGIGTL